ncbi:DUF6261 family protein [Ferruginibacter lapsinanis]|uniref:DUF6261 family protein n=1 Tax=Ferruginibacter lapsinanis TaxID=563172 RepID=UPI001E384465|nr:DUF6261 family protein [Ferruginibacter lapsinanis]UEG51120.1 DUF6261 family protein [Ferruginibacter lapsinanis]
MIKGIPLYNLRNTECAQFFQDTINIVHQNNPATLQVEKEYNALVLAGSELEALFKIPTASTITAELENFDLLRGKALRGISAIARGYTHSQNPVIEHHATVLVSHLALFGNVVADNYQSETASIRNIIEDWKNVPELSAAIAALNLGSWQTDLENANNSFADKYLQRAIEQSNKNPASFKEKRLQANSAYYKLRDAINAHYIINTDAEPFVTVVASLNGLIDEYNEMLARKNKS